MDRIRAVSLGDGGDGEVWESDGGKFRTMFVPWSGTRIGRSVTKTGGWGVEFGEES